MLPAGFFVGSATTVLLWLFQVVPHEVLLLGLGIACAWCLLIALALAFIVLYLGIACAYRLLRLLARAFFRVSSRVRALWGRRASASESAVGTGVRCAPARLEPSGPLVLQAARIGEPPQTPHALHSAERPLALPPASAADPALPDRPSVPALPPPPRNKRRSRRSPTPNRGARESD